MFLLKIDYPERDNSSFVSARNVDSRDENPPIVTVKKALELQCMDEICPKVILIY